MLEVRRELAGAPEAERGSEGNRRSQAYIAGRLARERPEDAVLSEEAPDRPARLHAERVWIVDPLDGTREFSDPSRSDWAVQVALWARGSLVAGSVSLAAQGLTLSADRILLASRQSGPLRVVVSRTRPPEVAKAVALGLGADLVPMGSAGAKVAAVIQGADDIYLQAGGQHERDSAAPVAVALAAGLHASRLDGSPLMYNQPDPFLPDLVVCRPNLTDQVLAAIREWCFS